MAAQLTKIAAVVLPAFCAALSSNAQACVATLSSNGGVYASVTAAVAAAQPVDTITINGSGGVCSENVLVDNTHLRMIITGINGATITGATTSPTLDLRVKGVEVANLTVNGGTQGILIWRNSNAFIQNVVAQGALYQGIAVSSMGFAVIVDSTIQNNGREGIVVYQLAAARIGLNTWETGTVTYQPNVIQNNGESGISVLAYSSVAIYANTITGNGQFGYLVSAAGVSSGGNTINSNKSGGIFVGYNAVASIGVTPSLSGPFPDQTTVSNGGYGVACFAGGFVGGHLGSTNQLMGSSGQFGFDPTCPEGTTQIFVP